VKAAVNPTAIAWVKVGCAAAKPLNCEVESRRGDRYLVFCRPAGTTHRKKIDPKLLRKLVPEQWEGVRYIYSKVIRLPGVEEG
jgi:hypothetical protein